MSINKVFNNEWTEILNEPETKESLTYLIEKLPEIKQSVESIEGMVTFGQTFLQDIDTIDSFENRLKTYPIDAEAIEAGVLLIGKLPLLLQHVQLLEVATIFLQEVFGDEQSMEQVNTSIRELPFVEKALETLDVTKQIKERFNSEPQEKVSIFTMMKWLKDPTVQQGLHVVKTALTVLGERRS